jgi:cytochrome c1
MVNVSHSEDEVKTLAEEVEYEDGPDDEGEMFQRPGKVKKKRTKDLAVHGMIVCFGYGSDFFFWFY